MTAPAAPIITAHSIGSRVIVRWRPVDTATDYNLYVDDGVTDGIDLQLDDTDLTSDGWFHCYTSPQVGQIEVYVTALNVGAEESDESTRIVCLLRGGEAEVPGPPLAVRASASR